MKVFDWTIVISLWLATLKLFGVVDLKWAWVVSPVWIMFGLGVVGVILKNIIDEWNRSKHG